MTNELRDYLADDDAMALIKGMAWRAFLKGVPKGTELDMRTSDNYPLNVRFTTQNGLQGEWVLAPWIVED